MLSPPLVDQAKRAEFSVRTRNFPKDTVEAVLRYGAPVGAVIEHLGKTGRCMDLARQRIRECEERGDSFVSGTVFIADELSGGKGRFQRSWHAPAGGIWMVLVMVNTLLPESAALCSLAAGVACCETVRAYQIDARIKWVNDVLINGRKVAGVLTETLRGAIYGEEYLLIGMGVNVNNTDFPPELEPYATAMAGFSRADLDVARVVALLLTKLSWNLGLLDFTEQEMLAAGRFDQENGPAIEHPLLQSWCSLSDTIGRRVRFGFNVMERPQYTAKVEGIDRQGGLVMRLADGSLITENSGEIVYLD